MVWLAGIADWGVMGKFETTMKWNCELVD